MSEIVLVPESARWEEAQALLEAEELGDGLPLVPPTEARMAAMLAGVGDPDAPLGFMPPLFGEMTPRTIAYNAVMAGCRPEELGVVAAALTACLEPEFNLLGLMTTTGSAAVATIVHGPIVDDLGLNSGINCLGPGNRANAAIGRAVSLGLRNIGGARAGSGDMATCGQPGKYTFCFAEPLEGIYPPLHVRRGLEAGTSGVTVLGLSGTAEVLPQRDGEIDAPPEAILDALSIIMRAAIETTGAAWQPEPPEQIFILPNELAERLAAGGIDLAGVQQRLYDVGVASGSMPVAAGPESIFPVVTGGPGIKMAYLPLWGGGSRMVTRAISGTWPG